MKKISVLLAMLLVAVFASQAVEKTTIYRMVLQTAQEFDELVVSGDVTVECRYNPQKAGYVVYHYNKDAGKKIECYNEGRCLNIGGHSENNGVMTRIVVFYDQPFKRIVNNGKGRVFSLRLVADKEKVELVNNGSGDMRFGVIKTKNACLEINNKGNIAIKRAKIENIETADNGTGEVILNKKLIEQ